MDAPEFTRLANNFYNEKNVPTDINRIALDSHLLNYIFSHESDLQKKQKVAFCCICINPLYWEFAKTMVEGAKQFFLPGHEVDYFLWSDIPKDKEGIQGVIDSFKGVDPNYKEEDGIKSLTDLSTFIHEKTIVFPTDSIEWPMPTLMRYHLFLQQEELLKTYDYVFYCDVDMRFVNVVGDEILGDGLTAALHPGYATDKKLWPPYEPNKNSASYIPRPGLLINDQGKRRFMPMYFAGGFQGGTSIEWFKAMREMKKLVDKDMSQNYLPIWNDETAWNKYLEKTPENLKVLTPSYIYPDSLIEEYYVPFVWGRENRYAPKLITVTKKFSTSKEGGDAVKRMINA